MFAWNAVSRVEKKTGDTALVSNLNNESCQSHETFAAKIFLFTMTLSEDQIDHGSFMKEAIAMVKADFSLVF